jgi:hypothetical protein
MGWSKKQVDNIAAYLIELGVKRDERIEDDLR